MTNSSKIIVYIEIKILIALFYTHKKKILNSWKFSTSDFRWIYMFWDEHDLTIFRECLSVCMSPKFCVFCISRTNARILMKLYIDIVWWWLDFGAYHLRISDVVQLVGWLILGLRSMSTFGTWACRGSYMLLPHLFHLTDTNIRFTLNKQYPWDTTR